MDLDQFQVYLGVRFRRQELLEQALTHRSYLNEHEGEELADNERLEFLGDAVLDFLIASDLYNRYPQMPEGELTRLRAALVRTETLAEVAAAHQVGEMLRMAKGEEISGGRSRAKNLCNAFEALLGAVYVDQGLDAAGSFALPRLVPMVEHILAEGLHIDARSLFQEWMQAVLNVTPRYRVVESFGPEHDKEFRVEALIGEQVAATGTGRSKQTAAQAAARVALRRLELGELQLFLPLAADNSLNDEAAPQEEAAALP